MVFVQKWPFLQHILERKNAFLGYKTKKFIKSKNWDFSKGVNPRFWSKNGHFFKFFFLGNIGQENVFYDILERKNIFLGQENVFYDILERKNVFLGYKNKKFEKNSRKIDIFPKGLTHGFGPKMAIFPTFFF